MATAGSLVADEKQKSAFRAAAAAAAANHNKHRKETTEIAHRRQATAKEAALGA